MLPHINSHINSAQRYSKKESLRLLLFYVGFVFLQFRHIA